jgi:hypothetical protein
VEEGLPELALEAADLCAHCRLGDRHALRGARELAVLGDRHEVRELAQVHNERFCKA